MADQPQPPTVTSSAREIFLRALDADGPEARQTLIETACGDDLEVRGEVEALLSENEALGDFLQAPAAASLREPPKVGLPLREAVVRETTGDEIGPFKLLERLGEGGCGTVYAAEQSLPVRRTVALKIIKLGMDTKSVIARFESERQALAMMDHPNIARVFDAGATDTGRPYFVMELVRGVPITEFCDQRKLSTGERLQLFVQVCNAIQHAHQKGIIHRDIKPTNILIADGDAGPTPKVIDFGIAKATEQRLTDRTLFTEIESFIGTPAYMSPEQAESSGIDIDTRSDIYSLGILLYELLVGQPPFDAAELHRLPLDQMRRTILEKEPERPSQKLQSLPAEERARVAELHGCDTAKLSGLLRGDLDWIVMRCLEKDRARRYVTASDIVSDIGRYLNAQPVLARPPSTLYRAKKMMRRHGAAITAGSILLATLVGGTFISVTQAIRATRAEAEAQDGRLAQAELRAKAERGEQEAKANAAAAMLNEYVADINLTQLALSEGNFGRAMQLLDKHRPGAGEIDNRGFEWHYLSALGRGDEHISLPNQRETVQCLAYSPDGSRLAIGLRGEVRLWDLATRSRITSLPGGASSLLFLRDGSTLASANRDTTWVVDTSTWLEVAELRENTGPLALSVDGTQLATSSSEGIRIWDTADWFERSRLPVPSAGARAFSPDGRLLAVLDPDGIKIWSIADARVIRVLDDSADLFDGIGAGSLIFTSDGRQVIAARNTRTSRGVFVLSVWEVSTGEETGVLSGGPGHTGAITSLSLNRQSNLLASASLDHSIGLWDPTAAEALRPLSGHRGEVWCVAISPDGRSVASGSKDGDLRIWPASPPPVADTIDGNFVPLAISADGRSLAASGADGSISIFGLPGLASERVFNAGPLATMSADLGRVAFARAGGTVGILELGTMEEVTHVASTEELDFLAISPDGTSLLSQSRLQNMRWWDLRELGSEPAATLDADLAVFSADGTTLAAFGLGGRIEIWDGTSKTMRNSWTADRSFGFSAALSPDGRRLATTGGLSDSENIVSIWDTAKGELIGTCLGHKQSVRSLAFSPDGRTLATASDDSSLKLWNVATRQELISIRRLGSTLRHLLFSSDGKWLVGDGSPNRAGGKLRLFHAP